MAIIKQTRLTFKEGSSDKEYNIFLEEVSSGSYLVNFSYGRRGGTLKSGTKTSSPVSLANAEKVYDRLENEKIGKGYKVDSSSKAKNFTPAPTKEAKKRTTAVVQLLKEVKTHADLIAMMADDAFYLQEKKDGERRTLDKSQGNVSGGNKKNEVIAVQETFVESLEDIEDVLLDGEEVGDTFYVFDILRYNEIDLRHEPYSKRLQVLRTLPLGDDIVIVPTATTKKQKEAFLAEFEESKCEGVVFKDKDGIYQGGRDKSTAYKYKFYKTATVKVVSLSKNKRSVQMGVKKGKSVIEVGSVTIPPNKNIPKVDSFIEVRYLYAYEGGSLFQPTFLFLRNDVDESDISIEQLEYKQEV